MMRQKLDFYQALIDLKLFGPHFRGESYAAWRTIGKVISGYTEDAFAGEEKELLFQITGGRRPFGLPLLSALWIVAGRRGGKSHFVAALALYWALLLREWRKILAAGERGVGLLIAPDRKQAKVLHR